MRRLCVLACLTMTMAFAAAAPELPAPLQRRDGANVFWSGHSLMDQPLPSHVAAIASSLGTPLRWNRQYIVGSSIVERTNGHEQPPGTWAGYRQGFNRDTRDLDVPAELRSGATIGGARYDTLVITEQHALLHSLALNDPVRHLRHFHERFIDANPQGRTFFYEPWISLDDKSDPRRWIAYERAAGPLWQCLGTRINASLALEGRADRIVPLPAGEVLAALVERATQTPGVPGVSRAGVRETVDALIADEVHLTPLGFYFMALVNYGAVFGRSPEGAWAPPGVTPEQATSLQALAWTLLNETLAARRAPTLAACRAHLRGEFAARYWPYAEDIWLKNGSLRERVRMARMRLSLQWRLMRGGPGSPLHFDPADDRGWWLPAPPP